MSCRRIIKIIFGLINNYYKKYYTVVRTFLLAITISIPFAVYSQENLVPNFSFENDIPFEKIEDINSWNKCMINDTPDYFTFDSLSGSFKEFNTFLKGPWPVDGNSYVGIFCYRTNPVRGIHNVRESLQVKLKEKLKRNEIYTLKLYAALDPESTHAIRNISVAFKSELSFYRKEKELFDTYPRVRFNNRFLSDTSWMLLQTQYKANGYEKYMIIGNLIKDEQTDKIPVNFEIQGSKENKWNLYDEEEAAYYYFDSISLSLTPEAETNDTFIIPERDTIKPAEETEDNNIISMHDVLRDSVFILEKVYFEFDKAEILPESEQELTRLLNFMNTYPDISIQIEGHTDNLGSYDYNIRLSLKRAKSVGNFLIDNGINKNRLKYIGYGFTRPIYDNTDEDGRKRNRRVAFKILE